MDVVHRHVVHLFVGRGVDLANRIGRPDDAAALAEPTEAIMLGNRGGGGVARRDRTGSAVSPNRPRPIRMGVKARSRRLNSWRDLDQAVPGVR